METVTVQQILDRACLVICKARHSDFTTEEVAQILSHLQELKRQDAEALAKQQEAAE